MPRFPIGLGVAVPCGDSLNERSALPVGLATSFAILSRGVGPRREREARRLLVWLARWTPGYLRRVFSSERLRWGGEVWQEIERDAVHHVLLAVLLDGSVEWAHGSDELALRWTKRVIRNFILTNTARARGRKQKLLELPYHEEVLQPDWTEALTARELLVKMRSEIPALVRARDLRSSIALFDDCIRDAFCLRERDAQRSVSGNRQRRRRGRLLAGRAWSRVTTDLDRDVTREELQSIALLLGLPEVSST